MATNGLDFEVIREPLRNGLEAAVNIIDRDFPLAMRSTPGLQPLLLLTTRNVQAVYQSILFLCSDQKDDPLRKIDFVVAALPLARTIADAVTNVAFVIADPEIHTRWYWASGWREFGEQIERRRQLNIPAEASWIAEQEREHQVAVARWHIPAEWVANPNKMIPWWPNLSKLSRKCLYTAERDLFDYLNSWFYRLLSSSSHSTAPGLRHGALLLLLEDNEHREAQLTQLRSISVFVTITLTLCYLSELRAGLKINIMNLPFIWAAVAPFFPPTNELYQLRYQELLARSGA
jgi:hypothetical protein